jgi:hypothetical protein
VSVAAKTLKELLMLIKKKNYSSVTGLSINKSEEHEESDSLAMEYLKERNFKTSAELYLVYI